MIARQFNLAKTEEQLIIIPDAMCKPPAIGFILMVRREPISAPVLFITWKLGESYRHWSPCELEGFGASVAVNKCSFYILRSTLPTLLFPDNKQGKIFLPDREYPTKNSFSTLF